MRIELARLHPSVMGHLQKIQENPDRYEGYYKKNDSRGGAIFGIIVVVVALCAAFIFPTEGDRLGLYVWIAIMMTLSWLGALCLNYMKRLKAAELKPLIFISPLYFIRTDLREITFYNLLTERKDLKTTDNYVKGSYNNTTFQFSFNDGNSETIFVDPKEKAIGLQQMLIQYWEYFTDAIEKEEFGKINAHDIFSEQKGKIIDDSNFAEATKKPSHLVKAVILGTILGTLFYYYNMHCYELRYSTYKPKKRYTYKTKAKKSYSISKKRAKYTNAKKLSLLLNYKNYKRIWCIFFKGQYKLTYAWFKNYKNEVKELKYSWGKENLGRFWFYRSKGRKYLDFKTLPNGKQNLYIQITLKNGWKSPVYKYEIDIKQVPKNEKWQAFYAKSGKKKQGSTRAGSARGGND